MEDLCPSQQLKLLGFLWSARITLRKKVAMPCLEHGNSANGDQSEDLDNFNQMPDMLVERDFSL